MSWSPRSGPFDVRSAKFAANGIFLSDPTESMQPAEVSMSTTERATNPTAATVDLKLEVVVIPVSDVDRAKRFYGSLGWRLDADFAAGQDWRVVQMTPPGSPCSIHFCKGVTTAVPGSVQNLYLLVSDIEAARGGLICRRADVSEAVQFTALRG